MAESHDGGRDAAKPRPFVPASQVDGCAKGRGFDCMGVAPALSYSWMIPNKPSQAELGKIRTWEADNQEIAKL